RSTSTARVEKSPRLPIGVLTTYKRPAGDVTKLAPPASVGELNAPVSHRRPYRQSKHCAKKKPGPGRSQDRAFVDDRSAARSTLLCRCRLRYGMLLKLRRQPCLRHGAHDRVHQLAVLEEQNGRNRSHVEPHRSLLICVDVQLRDLRLTDVLDGQLVEHGGDRAARAAPGRPKIDHGQALVLLDLVLERGIRYRQCIRHAALASPVYFRPPRIYCVVYRCTPAPETDAVHDTRSVRPCAHCPHRHCCPRARSDPSVLSRHPRTRTGSSRRRRRCPHRWSRSW